MKAATHRQEIPPIVLAISIHAAREGGDPHSEGFKLNVFISIHAAREGGDGAVQQYAAEAYNFNPRRP